MTEATTEDKTTFDVEAVRKDFPVLAKVIHGKPLVYLDNAATTQKPRSVIDRVHQFESEEYGTVRRGGYKLCEDSTRYYEESHQKMADLLGASNKNEIIFTSGTTQSINLVAYSFGRAFIHKGDEIIISTNKGRLIRCAVNEIRVAGRNTQGVRIIKLSGEEKVVSAIKIDDNLI